MTSITQVTESTVTVVVPLAIRRRNGRPKIVLPEHRSDHVTAENDPAAAKVPRAIARAWDWRRRLEAGEVSTLQDIADAENVTLPLVSRFIRLAYVSPMLLDDIVAIRTPLEIPIRKLARNATLAWVNQGI